MPAGWHSAPGIHTYRKQSEPDSNSGRIRRHVHKTQRLAVA